MSEKKTNKVLVVTDSCPVCGQVKEFLARKGLTHKVKLINASTPEGLKFARDNNISGVPECVVVDENGKQQRVCTKEEFEKILTDGT